jgi:short-subunit dehydrogenase
VDRPWQHAIVVGASSGIGAEIARQLGRDGCRLALVARRAAELAAVAAAINEHAPDRARIWAHDVTDAGAVPGLFQTICRDLGGLDLLVYAAGIMPRIAESEYDFPTDRRIVEVNVLGAVAWLNEAAQRFAQARAGTIVGISSVAGDRGRRGNPVYCASKAALDTYLEAVRNRVGRHGVAVVTAKPGPVDTPMTRGMTRLPFLVSAEEAARRILAGARRGATTVYVPARWRPIMFVIRHLPSPLMKRLDL